MGTWVLVFLGYASAYPVFVRLGIPQSSLLRLSQKSLMTGAWRNVLGCIAWMVNDQEA
jgi:hypothetical protein